MPPELGYNREGDVVTLTMSDAAREHSAELLDVRAFL
jgi:hypothetical protein